MSESPVSQADERITRTNKALELLTRQADAHITNSKIVMDGFKAFRFLETAYQTSRFYPEVDDVSKDLLDRAIETAFRRIERDEQRLLFVSRLEDAGLPVIRKDDYLHIIDTLAKVNPMYQWKWHTEMSPRPLGQFLDQERINQFQKMTRYWPEWRLTGLTNMFIWNTLSPETSAIKQGGINVCLTRSSKVTGTPGGQLNLGKVTLRPFVTGGMVGRPSDLSDEKRRFVIIDNHNRLSTGYKN
jgi:hypothetical protein